MIYQGLIKDSITLKNILAQKSPEEMTKEYINLFNDIWVETKDERGERVPIMAIDGSVNRAKLQTGTVFAVRATVIKVWKNVEVVLNREKMGILRFPKYWRERTILYMEGLEAELYNEIVSSDNENVMLMDGMFSVASQCRSELKLYGCDPFKGTLVELLDELREIDNVEEAIRTECGWKLEQYKEVAHRSRGVLTAYVGKTFMDNSIFGDPEIYDIEIISTLAQTPGFTRAVYDKIKIGCVNEEVTVTRSYMKFSKRGRAYVVEILGKVSDEELAKFHKMISYYSVKGYPLPLRLAHRRCEIPDKLFNTLLKKALGGILRTGREAL